MPLVQPSETSTATCRRQIQFQTPAQKRIGVGSGGTEARIDLQQPHASAFWDKPGLTTNPRSLHGSLHYSRGTRALHTIGLPAPTFVLQLLFCQTRSVTDTKSSAARRLSAQLQLLNRTSDLVLGYTATTLARSKAAKGIFKLLCGQFLSSAGPPLWQLPAVMAGAAAYCSTQPLKPRLLDQP